MNDSSELSCRYWGKARTDDKGGTETGCYPLVYADAVASPDK